MEPTPRFAKLATAAAAAAFLLLAGAPASHSARAADGRGDVLYVGDGGDNTITRFDARTGAFLSKLIPQPDPPLIGPMGVIREGSDLLVVNQNVFQPFNGEILRVNAVTGATRRVVAAADPKAPVAQRGIVLHRGDLFVADFNPDGSSGRILRYSTRGSFKAEFAPVGLSFEFHPRGVVIGPDGLLYVSNFPDLASGNGGQVLRFDPRTGAFVGVFVTNDASVAGDCTNRLHRPEGLVFGPDGNLYVTSFRGGFTGDRPDNDKILVFQGPHGRRQGACLGAIDLAPIGGERSAAQALLFGPEGDLFVPITFFKDAGAVRRYRTKNRPVAQPRRLDDFVSPGEGLGQGWYLTFGKTDPGTLAYRGPRRGER